MPWMCAFTPVTRWQYEVYQVAYWRVSPFAHLESFRERAVGRIVKRRLSIEHGTISFGDPLKTSGASHGYLDVIWKIRAGVHGTAGRKDGTLVMGATRNFVQWFSGQRHSVSDPEHGDRSIGQINRYFK